tara:strand:- start:892 stop:1215 length:324 start_codon:yes stop_codon:yes gene_type:complete
MTNTIRKDKRRKIAFLEKENYNEAWKVSLKYSSFLMRYCERAVLERDVYGLCCSLYGQYMNELKDKQLLLNRNYVQIWDTMLNTVKKGEKVDMAVKLLHQTNVQRNN